MLLALWPRVYVYFINQAKDDRCSNITHLVYIHYSFFFSLFASSVFNNRLHYTCPQQINPTISHIVYLPHILHYLIHLLLPFLLLLYSQLLFHILIIRRKHLGGKSQTRCTDAEGRKVCLFVLHTPSVSRCH